MHGFQTPDLLFTLCELRQFPLVLGLSFSLYKVGIIIVPASQSHWRINEIISVKPLVSTAPGTQ